MNVFTKIGGWLSGLVPRASAPVAVRNQSTPYEAGGHRGRAATWTAPSLTPNV